MYACSNLNSSVQVCTTWKLPCSHVRKSTAQARPFHRLVQYLFGCVNKAVSKLCTAVNFVAYVCIMIVYMYVVYPMYIAPVGPPKNMMAFAGTTSIQLQWESPFDPKGLIAGYAVLYQLMWTNVSLTSPRPLVALSTEALETEVVLRPLLENSLYRMVVYAETNTSTGPGSEELRVFTKPRGEKL